MEKHLKERLVGAGVLVAIGVILIPLLLDGPEPQQTRRIGLELPGASGDAKTHVIRLDENGQKTLEEAPGPDADPAVTGVIGGQEQSAPAPSAPSAAREARATETDVPAIPEAQAPDPAPAPAEQAPAAVKTPPAAPAPAGDWYVQVGSFSDPANARRLRERLSAEGHAVQLSEVASGGRTLHRVRVGPVASRADAEALAGRLGRVGHKGSVVAGGD